MVLETAVRPGVLLLPRDSRLPARPGMVRLRHTHQPGSDLYWTREARALRTKFRKRGLETIIEAAKTQLGPSIKSAIVSTWSQPGESDSTILLLSITARVDRTELRRVRKAILAAIADEASAWTDEERQDYGKRFYFELEPLSE